jgi:F-type H+-transporting ATPase subunit b
MGLVTPDYGLLFWMLLTFGVVVFVLGKYAWKPILTAIKERENSIDQALKSADKMKEQMAKLKADNEKILGEARMERDKLMKEARELKDQIIAEARVSAAAEGNKMLELARQAINNERAAAVDQIRAMVASLSVDIAEKLLQKKLEGKDDQKALIDQLLNQTKFN